ncbi:hypothetical protein Tco_1112953 [Tanacetum coccineum]|uniref:Uncharacterized protein n=1 Tax=Tanacetum coccineum TaxID=301880 RepID=A0ABQ5IS95_9ASTR
MESSHQQSIVDAGSNTRRAMLGKGSYVTWSSRFLRYIDGKKEHGIKVINSIFKGPYKFREITNPTSPTEAPIKRMQEYADLTGEDKLRYEADVDAMNWILLAISNDMFNFMNACHILEQMWKRVQRLMQGIDLSLHERHSRLMNEVDKFYAEAGEYIESVEWPSPIDTDG